MRAIWRGVRARGWQADLSATLLAVALASSTTVFSAIDAFVSIACHLPEPPSRSPRGV
jgi:hypothetical protein